jgi:membrane protein DedA with SNARE-associated domain
VDSFLDPVIAFASAHTGLAYGTLFLAALLEAVPVLGSVVPGSTIILALSALIPTGQLELVGVLASAAAGAALGDGLAFLAGRRGQRRILNGWPLSRFPDLVARAEAFFERFGGLAVFFGRFVPPIRAFVPVTAGALRMTPLKFFAIDLPAVMVWAPAHVLPGVVAATAIEHGHFTGHHWLPVLAGVVATILVLLWAYRRGKDATPAR